VRSDPTSGGKAVVRANVPAEIYEVEPKDAAVAVRMLLLLPDCGC
jgi:hypothetical protein